MTTPSLSVDSVAHTHLADVTSRILALEGLTTTFTLSPHTHDGDLFRFNNRSTFLFTFPALHRHTYKMLLSFDLSTEKDFVYSLSNELEQHLRDNNIHRLVLWSHASPDEQTKHHLKRSRPPIDILCTDMPAGEMYSTPLRYFVPLDCQSLEYSFLVNFIAGQLVVRLKKLFHLILSEIAAPIYDRNMLKLR